MQRSNRGTILTFAYGWFSLICIISPVTATVEKDGGATLSLWYSYQNPGSLREDGKKCDWVGDQRCDVFINFCLKDGSSKSQEDNDCSLVNGYTTTRDNTDNIADVLKMYIPKPVPRTYALRVTIYDSDMFRTLQIIGDFTADVFPLRPNGVRTPVKLRRKTESFNNKKLKFEVELNLTCVKNYYGDQCDTFCVPVEGSYICDDQGNRICNPGLRGEYCKLEDSCHFEPCAEYAICTNKPDNMGRICECDGREAPECYPGYNPCQRNPCQNGGTCQPSGKFNASFVCSCALGWTGHRCADKASACKEAEKKSRMGEEESEITSSTIKSTDARTNSSELSAVCLNGGTCYDHVATFTYRCVCLPGWIGDHCETANPAMESTKTSTYMLWVTIPICSLLVFVIAILGYRYRRSRRILMHMNKKGGIVYYHNNSNTVSLSNNDKEHQTHFSNKNYASMRSYPDKSIVESTDLYKHSDENISSDVYDECNPLGLECGTNVYETTFDVDCPPSSDNQATEIPSSQEIPPPLPNRHKYPAVSPPCDQKAPHDINYLQTTEIPGPPYSFVYDSGTRRSRVFRPQSPPTFAPGSALDKKMRVNHS